MEHEQAAGDLEVARILRMLPHLVWEAQHPRPCTHNLRWGARKRRSAGDDEPQPPPSHFPAVARRPPRPPPPYHHPAARRPSDGKPNKKRSGDHAKPCRVSDTLEAVATALAPVCTGLGSDPAAPETSSPESSLEFCPSGEEPDAKAKPRPPEEGPPSAKKPKSNHRELAKRIDQLIHTRRELQEEAEKTKNRLEAARWRYSKLVELKLKLEKETRCHHQQQQQHPLHEKSYFDLPLTCTVQTIPRAQDHVRPGSHNIRNMQPSQHPCPKQWVIVHQPTTTGFSIRPSVSLDRRTAVPAVVGKHHCNWVVASQPLRLAGNHGGSRPCKIPDLNTRVNEDLAWN